MHYREIVFPIQTQHVFERVLQIHKEYHNDSTIAKN